LTLEGKDVVVTGATDGIGKVAALELAKMGAGVTIVARNAAKAEAAVQEMRRAAGHGRIDFVRADLAEQTSVRAAAGELRRRLKRLDVLLNNAGALFQRRETTGDNIERTFALNHLAYFLLTNELLDLLKAAAPARIVNVASGAHHGAELDFANLQNGRNYSGWRAYQQSKLANIYFTYELARRLEGTNVSANCLHPGFVATKFGDNNRGTGAAIFGLAKKVGAKSVTEGAKTSIYLAGSPEVEGVSGRYFEDCRPVRSSAVSYNEQVARNLWLASERLVGSA
jgi:NAD(P)-dependent dehydrogenase (short-subunit alcohol dehydrogenase family)